MDSQNLTFKMQYNLHQHPLKMKCCPCSITKLCPTLCDPTDCSTPSSSVLHYLPEFIQIHVHRVGDAIQPSHPLLPPSPFAFNLFQHRIFSNQLTLCIKWLKYWSFSFSNSPSDIYLGLTSFRIDWFELLVVQGTLKSLPAPQFESINSSWFSLLYVQLSHLRDNQKTIALTRCTFVSKVMYLLFNMLSSFVIVFLPRSKCLLISCLQSSSSVIFEPKKTKSVIVSIVSPFIYHEITRLDAMILFFEC